MATEHDSTTEPYEGDLFLQLVYTTLVNRLDGVVSENSIRFWIDNRDGDLYQDFGGPMLDQIEEAFKENV